MTKQNESPHVTFSNETLKTGLFTGVVHLARPGERVRENTVYAISPDEWEDLQSSAAIRAWRADPDEGIPIELIQAIEGGANPIRTYRKYRKVTAAALAAAAGTSQSHVSEIETGKKAPSLKLLRRLADALEIDVE
ncbi:MAG: helix-turn-helix transcriptional regulator, partial [Rhodospirillaceae bacterium]|nr:helix-turn-helix transcriptional regulator [Rhodospirillaceae bacterium]